MAAYPRAALRVPVASPVFRDSSDRCRKRVIAPPTESRRWPETPGSDGQTPLGSVYWCRPLRSKRAASAVSLMPTACGRCDRRRQIRRCRLRRALPGYRATGVGKPPEGIGGKLSPCAPQTGALSRGPDFSPSRRFTFALAAGPAHPTRFEPDPFPGELRARRLCGTGAYRRRN